MKFIFALFFLVSCTAPQIVSATDKNGNPIHSVLKEPFFGAPNQASEWSFWYFIFCILMAWIVWKEFKSVRWPKKKIESSNNQMESK